MLQKLKRVDLWFALVGIVVSVFFLLKSYSFPPHPVSAEPGPALFPRAMFTGWIIVSLILLAFTLAKKEIEKEAAANGDFMLAVYTTAAMIVFLLLFEVGGYLLMNTLLLIYTMRISGIKSLRRLLSYSILYSLISYFIFVKMLNVPLPQGFIPL